ncbi:hypothetical protein [Arthrobacter cheniae]|nr:hypothetical protein [Arthrobacter cheniae]
MTNTSSSPHGRRRAAPLTRTSGRAMVMSAVLLVMAIAVVLVLI